MFGISKSQYQEIIGKLDYLASRVDAMQTPKASKPVVVVRKARIGRRKFKMPVSEAILSSIYPGERLDRSRIVTRVNQLLGCRVGISSISPAISKLVMGGGLVRDANRLYSLPVSHKRAS